MSNYVLKLRFKGPMFDQGGHCTGKTGNLDVHFSRQGICVKILKICFYANNLLLTQGKLWISKKFSLTFCLTLLFISKNCLKLLSITNCIFFTYVFTLISVCWCIIFGIWHKVCVKGFNCSEWCKISIRSTFLKSTSPFTAHTASYLCLST